MSHGSGKMHDSTKLSEVKPRFSPSDAVCFRYKSSGHTCPPAICRERRAKAALAAISSTPKNFCLKGGCSTSTRLLPAD
jgi:hypothetical protein